MKPQKLRSPVSNRFESAPQFLESVADMALQLLAVRGKPHGAAVVPKTLFVASGSLEDGRSFHVRGLHVEGSTMRTSIYIR